MSRTFLYHIFWTFAVIFLQFKVEGSLFLSSTQCYGINTNHLLEIECQNHNEEVVLNSLKLGSKLNSTNCTETKDTNLCCQWDQENDCYFDYGKPLIPTGEKFRKCYGKFQCWFVVDWALNIDECPTSKFGMTTQYMTAEYLCAEKNNIIEVCSQTGPETISREGKPIYLKSPGYPYLKKGTCKCHIQTRGRANHRIELKALNTEINYPQSLFVFDESEEIKNPMKNITHNMYLSGLRTLYSVAGTKPAMSLWYLPQKEFAFYFVVDSPIGTTINVSCTPFKREALFTKIERSRNHIGELKTRNNSLLFDLNFLRILIPVIVLLLIAIVLIIVTISRWKHKRKLRIQKVASGVQNSKEDVYDNTKELVEDEESGNSTKQLCSKTCQAEICKKSPSPAMDKSSETPPPDNGCVNSALEPENGSTVELRTES